MRRSVRPEAVLALLLQSCVALAAEEHGGHGAHAAPSISTLVLPLVNFALFIGLFAYYAWPLIAQALAERRRVVEKDLAESDQVRRDAAAMLADVEAKRARVREDGERLLTEIRTESEHDRERMVRAARQTAERTRSDASLLAEQESARAAHRIREDLAERVIERATAALRERLGAEDEERFAADFVSAVEGGEAR